MTEENTALKFICTWVLIFIFNIMGSIFAIEIIESKSQYAIGEIALFFIMGFSLLAFLIFTISCCIYLCIDWFYD